MKLPRAIRPWTQELSIFPEDVALSLGGIVQKLSLLFGQVENSILQGKVEPDGISGLQTKPVYERLLLSEWLLAEEIPDEFDRRAVMGEHLFFKRHTRNSIDAKLSIVLIDCGPAFIGTPRLVQIALLICLSRRASVRQSQFLWGVLQEPGTLYESVSEYSLMQFINARSALEVSERRKQQWQAVLESYPAVSDVWVIGEEHLQIGGFAPNRILLEDVLLPGDRSINVSVQSGNKKRQANLGLPDDKVCTRILRNPFAGAVSSFNKTSFSFSNNLYFCGGGRKLAISLDNGGVAVYPVPNSARAKPGYSKEFVPPEGHTIVAVQSQKKRVSAISEFEGALYSHNFPGTRQMMSIRVSGDVEAYIDTDKKGFRHFLFSYATGYTHCAFFIDDALQLFRITFSPDEVEASLVDDAVTNMMIRNDGVCYTKVESEQEILLVSKANSYSPRTDVIHLDEKTSGEALIGYDYTNDKNNVVLAIASKEPDNWRMVYGSNTKLLTALPRTKVIGALLPPRDFYGDGNFSNWPTTALLLEGQSRNHFTVINKTYEFSTPCESSAVADALFDPMYGQLAYILAAGEVKVYSILKKEFVLAIKQGAHGS